MHRFVNDVQALYAECFAVASRWLLAAIRRITAPLVFSKPWGDPVSHLSPGVAGRQRRAHIAEPVVATVVARSDPMSGRDGGG